MIFISYRRNDSSDMVGRIYDHLAKKFPGQVFKDVDSIPPGTHYPSYIIQCLEKTKFFLPMIGHRWFETKSDGTRRIDEQDDFVRIEIESALASGITIIPIIIGDAIIPALDQLPKSLVTLSQLQSFQVRSDPDFRQDINKLINLLTQHIKPNRHRKRLLLVFPVLMFFFIASLFGIEIYQSYKSPRMINFINPKISILDRIESTMYSWIFGSPDDVLSKKSLEKTQEISPFYHTAWIFMGYFDQRRRVFIEGPFAHVILRPSSGIRGEILRIIGDVLKITKSRRLIIAKYKDQGSQYELSPPASLSDPLKDSDDTGKILSKGSLVIVRDVDVAGYRGRPDSVWCRISPCDSDNPSCGRAQKEQN